MTKIHKFAEVSPKAQLACDVVVGPYTVIGPGVTIDSGCDIKSHVVLRGPTSIGKNNTIFQFCSIGEDTQDLKFKGEKTYLEVGDNNTFREYVSVHRGTAQDDALTKIGDGNLFVTGSHVAHDCIVGSHTIIGHHVGLAGHVQVGDYAILSSYAAVHQFTKVGAHAFLGHLTMLVMDLPPFMLAVGGDSPRAATINAEGLKRRGFSADDVSGLRKAYKILYRQDLLLEKALEKLAQLAETCPSVQMIIDFIKSSTRGILR